MAKMLICPKCGLYQEDTKAIRKIGVAIKKAALFGGQQAIKMGAKAVVGAIPVVGDNMVVQHAAGNAGTELANAFGLNPDNAVISDVMYKCSSCSHYWEGQDDPSCFNQIQLNTVRAEHESRIQALKKEYNNKLFTLIVLVVCLAFVVLLVKKDVTDFMAYVIPLIAFLWQIINVAKKYKQYAALKEKSDIAFAREDMGVGA